MNRKYFIGLELNLEKEAFYKAVIKKISVSSKKKGIAIKWVPEQNLHITLAFLGELEEEILEIISPQVESVIAQFSPIQLKLTGVDAFPSQLGARVLYIGVQSKKVLHDLNAQLLQELSAHLQFSEEREYRPHLTLGRIKNACSVKDIVSPFQRKTFGKYKIDQVHLYKSESYNYNPVYEKIFSYKLIENEEENGIDGIN